jgi:hypothetical protein
VQHGKPREDGNGNWPDRQVVTLLTGDRTVQVEYSDDNAAKAAIGDPQPTDEVMVPVGVRAAKGFVFYYGRRP